MALELTDSGHLLASRAIADQVGPLSFRLLGTTQKVYDRRSLLFNFKGCKEFNWIRIALLDDDRYTVTFSRVARGPQHAQTKHTETHQGIYAEELHTLITECTGVGVVPPLSPHSS